MVEIFKTNVQETSEAEKLLQILNDSFPSVLINFDLDDHDRVLRVEGSIINNDEIVSIVNNHGFTCKVIPDKLCK